MSRITDTHRGARIAFDAAFVQILQPDLFGGTLPRSFWQNIAQAAADQLNDCSAYELACGRPSGFPDYKIGGEELADTAESSTAHGGPSVGNLGAACRAHVVHTVPQGRSTVPAGGVGHAGSRA